MGNEPLISICIPTRDRVDILRETLRSILAQEVDPTLFEVCVSDNSPTDETKELMEKEFGGIPHLMYRKSDCEGFLNSIEALQLGKGKLLKLNNDYSKWAPGGLAKVIDCVQRYEKEKPELFFALGALGRERKLFETASFDRFLDEISYYSTWSSAFSIWKTDFDTLMEREIAMDPMFPHTSLLFALADKGLYVVDHGAYVENQPLQKKGGYNLIDNFVRIYLAMVADLLRKKKISRETYRKIEHEIIKFAAIWFAIVLLDKRFSFTFENKEVLIAKTCGTWAVWKFYFYFLCRYYPRLWLKKLILHKVP